jgi:hypothetical protein
VVHFDGESLHKGPLPICLPMYAHILHKLLGIAPNCKLLTSNLYKLYIADTVQQSTSNPENQNMHRIKLEIFQMIFGLAG